TILKVAPEVDAGDILLTQTVAIEPEETSGEIAEKLAALGAVLIVPALEAIESGRAVWIPQPAAGTDAPKIAKAEARINWRKDAVSIKNIVRGLNPNPGAYFIFRNGRVKLWRAAAAPGESGAQPGTIEGLMPAGPVVVCGEGTVLLTEVQPAGKKAMTGAEFIRGYRPIPGDMLE
ncbi:MAG: methionyl-tRNA formyltransferase, partial [Actinomycetota bacterium]